VFSNCPQTDVQVPLEELLDDLEALGLDEGGGGGVGDGAGGDGDDEMAEA